MARPDTDKTKPVPTPNGTPKETASRPGAAPKPVFTDYASL